MTKAGRRDRGPSQLAAFKKMARELDCSESEAVFDAQLGKIGRAAVPRKPVKRKKGGGIKVALKGA